MTGIVRYPYEVEQRPVSHVFHDEQVRAAAAAAADNAVQVDNIDVIKLHHHRRLRHHVPPISLRSRLAQRFHRYRGRRSTDHLQMTLTDVTELTCSSIHITHIAVLSCDSTSPICCGL